MQRVLRGGRRLSVCDEPVEALHDREPRCRRVVAETLRAQLLTAQRTRRLEHPLRGEPSALRARVGPGEEQHALRAGCERGEVVASLLDAAGRVDLESGDATPIAVGQQRIVVPPRRERALDRSEDVHGVEVAAKGLTEARDERSLAEAAGTADLRVELGAERAAKAREIDTGADGVEGAELLEDGIDPSRRVELCVPASRAGASPRRRTS